jgi:hypothetical protein
MDKGQLLYDQKKYAEAISVFQLALKFRPLLRVPIIGWANARKNWARKKTRDLITNGPMDSINR